MTEHFPSYPEHAALRQDDAAPVITGFSGSPRDGRCLEVWFDRDVSEADRAWMIAAINEKALRAPAQGSPRCDRCGSSGDTYVLCSGCGMPASPPYPVQSALKECASRCRYDGDLFHDQGNIARRDASWKAADMAEAALSALTSTEQK